MLRCLSLSHLTDWFQLLVDGRKLTHGDAVAFTVNCRVPWYLFIYISLYNNLL